MSPPPIAHCDCNGQSPKTQPPRSGFGLLARILDTLESLPSVRAALGDIVKSRRNTRPGFPPHAMWRALCVRYLLRMRYTRDLVVRLERDDRLREICGFGDATPSESTFSRFFSRVSEDPGLGERFILEMVEKVQAESPGVGEMVAIDSTDIEAYANPRRSVVRDPDVAWGHRTAKNKSRAKKTEPFFGYKMHSLIDATYGVPLAHVLLPANENDSPQLSRLVRMARKDYPWLKPKYLLADRGYDAESNHRFLYERGIAPIILPRKPTADDGLYDVLYNKDGFPVCGDGRTAMSYVGTDATAGRHLFRCPPEGCALKKRSTGAMQYCDPRDPFRVDPTDNLRAVGVVARASAEWKRLYSRRPIIERAFRSLKHSRLLNQHQYIKRKKIETHANLSTLTYLATMLARVKADDVDRIRHMNIGLR